MTMIERTQMRSSGQLGQILLNGLEEIIGKAGVNAVLDQARLFRLMKPSQKEVPHLELADFAEIQAALEALYGERGGQGTAFQAGRVSFHSILRDWGDEMGLYDPEFRLHSTVCKIEDGLRALAEKFSELFSGQVYVSEDETAWIWQVECESASINAQLMRSCDPFISGVLQEFTQWVAGGKHYLLHSVVRDDPGEESGCIRIEKQAID